MATYSVSFRLRRVVTESTFVSVPITDELMMSQAAGSQLNVEKIAQAAIEMGNLASTIWQREGEALIELHPLQTPPL